MIHLYFLPENMSSSSEIVDFSEQKPARMSEMLTFSQKCGMFNQYLKEKGSFGDLSLGMSCSVEPNGEHKLLYMFHFFFLFQNQIIDKDCGSYYVLEFQSPLGFV